MDLFSIEELRHLSARLRNYTGAVEEFGLKQTIAAAAFAVAQIAEVLSRGIVDYSAAGIFGARPSTLTIKLSGTDRNSVRSSL